MTRPITVRPWRFPDGSEGLRVVVGRAGKSRAAALTVDEAHARADATEAAAREQLGHAARLRAAADELADLTD